MSGYELRLKLSDSLVRIGPNLN